MLVQKFWNVMNGEIKEVIHGSEMYEELDNHFQCIWVKIGDPYVIH